jgi:hypothetical protein
MGKLQDEQPPYDRAVCDAMVASTPDDWNVIVLTIERPPGSTAVGELFHSITSSDRRRPIMPDDSLYEATYRLDELFQRHGALFRRAIYRVSCSPTPGSTADFEYDPPKPKRARRPNHPLQQTAGALPVILVPSAPAAAAGELG